MSSAQTVTAGSLLDGSPRLSRVQSCLPPDPVVPCERLPSTVIISVFPSFLFFLRTSLGMWGSDLEPQDWSIILESVPRSLWTLLPRVQRLPGEAASG